MQSSLAAQLAGIRANNNATILDKSKRKKIHSVSLVYEPREAASQDFESIYYDCLEAFRDLESIDSRFGAFTNSLFSETSIRFDRMIQTSDQADALNRAIEQFLMLISGYLHLNPSFRALEWLVRRFQIQIHNTEALLLAVLPYHDSPSQFVRILDIISTQQLPPLFQFLSTCKQSMQGPSRSALVRVCTRDTRLYDVINQFELATIKNDLQHNRQLVFWTSINVMVAMVHKEQGEAVEAADKLLPLVSEVVALTDRPEAQVAAYMILSVLATQFNLSEDVLVAAVNAVVLNWSQGSAQRGLACVAQLMESLADKEKAVALNENTWNALAGSFGSVEGLVTGVISQLSSNVRSGKLANAVMLNTLTYSPAEFPAVIALVQQVPLCADVVNEVVQYILTERPTEPELSASLVQFVELIVDRLSPAKVDRLEVALQSSIKRPQATLEENENSEMVEDDESELMTTGDATAKTELSVSRQQVIDEAANMEQSTVRSFLETPLSTQDPRAQLWSRSTGIAGLSFDDLRQLARVSPEAQLSFVLAIAIGPWPTVSRCMAIRVAHAMVDSVLSPEKGGSSSGADFQYALPIALFLLSDSEKRVRKEASKLVRSFALAKPTAKRTPKWQQESHSNISWLSASDLQHVMSRLVETLEECIMDSDYVFVAARKAGKAAWCEFLVSHALNTRLPQVLWFTLRALATFKGVSKQVAGLLAEWNRPATQQLWQQLCKEAKFPISGIERALVSVLRSNDNSAVTFLLDVMRTSDPNRTIAPLAGDHIAQIWNEVFRPETQERIADALVDICVDDKIAYDPQDVLLRIQPFSSALFTRLLSRTASANGTNGEETAQPLFNETSKRRRRRSSSFVQLRGGPRDEVAAEAEKHLRRTTLVLELLEKSARQLKDTPPLVSVLFDILEELMALGEGSRLPVLYTEELLANCMIALVENLKALGIKSRELSSLKVSAVVSCIRSSPSPQVQNRLLLLVAALATLCPDVVLHGVMPIFTFMGANTVRLDNDFSAHVIEQTIEQVIPALVAAGDKHEEIEMALMSFVAAFPHVPRHRRNTLFGALIKTLGASQSLYKLLLLLGQRYAEVVSSGSGASRNHRSSADAKALVHFTTPFLRSFTAGEQMRAMSSYVRFIIVQSTDEEDSRFGLLKIKEALKQSTSSPALRNSLFDFLARTAGEPDIIAGTQPLRVQVSRRGDALSGEEWDLVSAMIGALLNEVSQNNAESAAGDLLVKVLEMLPIDRFISVTKPLITPTNERVLSLVSSKFQYESIEDEIALSAAKDVTQHLADIVGKHASSPVIDAVEPIITKFGTKLREQEMQLLEHLVGSNGLLNQDVDVVLSSILAINAICQQLGAATYGFFPRIFPVLCAKVQRAQDQDQLRREGLMDVDNTNNLKKSTSNERSDDEEDEEEDEDDDIQLAVFALFAGLVRQMPRFMTPEMPTILDLVFASHISVSSRLQLLKVLDDKIEPLPLLSSLTKCLPAVLRGGIPAVGMFFASLENAIEKVSKRELTAEIPQFTNLLLGCFSVRQSVENANVFNQIEAKSIECAISAVLRLNDRVIRPQFKRIVSWGFENNSAARQTAVLKFVNRILGQLKGVVTNYYGFMLDEVCAVLDQGNDADPVVRKLVLQSLITSFTFDQDDFWQSPSRFDSISEALVGQLVTEPMTHGPLIVKSITALALASSTQHRKRINDSLTNLIGSTAPVTQKVWTIKVFSSLYKRLGEDWMANLPQLVPLIAELLDDEDESVELETRKSLVPVIENVLGESLDRYLA